MAGRTLKAGDEVEVNIGGNWHRATVRKKQGAWELILGNGRAIGAVGLIARSLERQKD